MTMVSALIWLAAEPTTELHWIGGAAPVELLRDRSLNFQLNRWISYGGESILAHIQAMLPRLVSLRTVSKRVTGRSCLVQISDRYV